MNILRTPALLTFLIFISTTSVFATTFEFDFADGVLGELTSTISFENDDEEVILTVTGYYWDGDSWETANLYRRNQDNDHGLGVCNPEETPCPGPSGGGDINELDNDGKPELIALWKDPDYDWYSLGLSSLDGNAGDPEIERGVLWGADSGSLAGVNDDLSDFGGSALDMFEFEGGTVEPDLNVSGVAYTYLFFQPIDWSFDPILMLGGGHGHHSKANDNNDFLIRGAVLNRSDVPEPSSLLLIVGGLALVARVRRRRN